MVFFCLHIAEPLHHAARKERADVSVAGDTRPLCIAAPGLRWAELSWPLVQSKHGSSESQTETAHPWGCELETAPQDSCGAGCSHGRCAATPVHAKFTGGRAPWQPGHRRPAESAGLWAQKVLGKISGPVHCGDSDISGEGGQGSWVVMDKWGGRASKIRADLSENHRRLPGVGGSHGECGLRD